MSRYRNWSGGAAVLLLAWIQAVCICGPAAAQMRGAAEVEAGDFLIASRNLTDPNFARTVVLLVACNDEGAMGVILNRPTEVTLGEMVGDEVEGEGLSQPVWIGGPVAGWQLLLLFRAEDGVDDAESVLADIYFSGSRLVLESLLETNADFRVYAGYAGWAPGQLEAEIDRQGWHVLPGDPEMVFDADPASLWQELIVRGEARWAGLPLQRPDSTRVASWFDGQLAAQEVLDWPR